VKTNVIDVNMSCTPQGGAHSPSVDQTDCDDDDNKPVWPNRLSFGIIRIIIIIIIEMTTTNDPTYGG
jgi:hypothetical protein